MPTQITTSVAEAATALQAGQAVAIPTETVYGLAGDATNEQALAAIFNIKGRPRNHPLIVHCVDAASAFRLARDVPQVARDLAARFWPGPLTLVLDKQPQVSTTVTAGQDTVAVRVPSHPLTLQLLEQFPAGLAAPSANRYTKVSPTTAQHVARDLGERVALILDGGPCEIGIESTIVDCTQDPPVLLRAGYVTVEEIEALLGYPLMMRNAAGTLSPGQQAIHYAPEAQVFLTELDDLQRTVDRLTAAERSLLVISPVAPIVRNELVTWWRIPEDHAEFARRIYGCLREADAVGFPRVLIVRPESTGIGRAIIDRLEKAAKAAEVH